MTWSAVTGDSAERLVQGVRQHLLILPTVICSTVVCERISERIDGAVALTHQHGCSQIGADAKQTFRILKGFAENPNVGGVLVISLGCEVIDADKLVKDIQSTGKPVEFIRIQDVGGSLKAIEAGVAAAAKLKAVMDNSQQVHADQGQVCVGVKWGEGSSFSVMEKFAQRFIAHILDAGGTVLLGETKKVRQAVANGKVIMSEPVAHKFLAQTESEETSNLIDVREEPLPTHLDSTTAFSYMDLSSRPIDGILAYGERPTEPGLYVMNSPDSDVECLTGFAAAGCSAVVFFTNEGSTVGSPILPVIKISFTNSNAWEEHVDLRLPTTFDEGSYGSLEACIGGVLSGNLTKSELLGHDEFAIHRIGPSL